MANRAPLTVVDRGRSADPWHRYAVFGDTWLTAMPSPESALTEAENFRAWRKNG